MMNKSESIKELSIALAKFQGDITNPNNSKTVSAGAFSYKYAPLDEILNLVRPTLSKHGLSIVQIPVTSEGMVGVSTTLLHSSGEWIETLPILLKLDKQSAQGAGSAITYARRYSLSAVLGISSEDDDDATSIEFNKSSSNLANKSKTASVKQDRVIANTDKQSIIDGSLASEAQIQYIDNLLKKKNYNDKSIKEYLKKAYNKDDIKALTKKEAGETINMLNDMK